jgi:hypothetical protein
MLLTGTGFLEYFDAFPARSDWSILGSKVLASTIYSRLPVFKKNWVRHPEDLLESIRRRGYRVDYGWPYHPSDWFHFGRRDDVWKIWDIPLATEPETAYWFRSRPRPENDVSPLSLNRYTPEQHVWLSFLRKARTVACDHKWDVTPETVIGTENSIASNLILITPKQAGITFAKYEIPTSRLESLYQGAGTCYSHGLWKEAYQRHCCGRKFSAASVHRLSSLANAAAYQLVTVQKALRMKLARARGRIGPRAT